MNTAPRYRTGGMTCPARIIDAQALDAYGNTEGLTIADAYGPTYAARIVHALNHAEALADALRNIAESDPARTVPDNQFDAGWLAAHEKFCSYARATLAAYEAQS